MSKVSKDDYGKIVEIYNESGNKSAIEYITMNYGLKHPSAVLSKIKKSSRYRFDEISKKFITNTEPAEEAIFMGIDELCKQPITTSICKIKDPTLDLLYQELMQEKLLELTKYVRLSRYSNTITINKTALIADGYLVAIS